MQCKEKHFIYSVNKKAIMDDYEELIEKGILKRNIIEWLGNGNPYWGIDKFFTGKEWVFYDRKPRGHKNRLAEALYIMGYMNYNEVGCGKCEICKIENSKQWTTKGYCESQMWKNKCFITLTYNNENLPDDRKLRRSDIQKFWKDLRYHLYKETKKTSEIDLTKERENMEEIYSNILEDMFGKNSRRKNRYPIRYLNCGEYGPKTKRPHYHAVIWNFEPLDMKRHSKDPRGYWIYTSEKLNKIWGKGYVIVGMATTETCAYVARYCTKKYSRTKEEQEKMKKKKQLEFIGASSMGFIGYFYWIKNKESIKENGGIVMRNREKTYLAKIPKAMQKVWKLEDDDSYETYDWWKNKVGKENWEKILSKTDLTESEYIEDTYRQRMKKYRLLKRSKGDQYE